MSKVLERLQRAREAGKLSREDTEGATDLYKMLLNAHNGDEEAAEGEFRWYLDSKEGQEQLLGWMARARARARPKPAPVPLSTKLLQAIIGAIIGGLAGIAVTAILYYVLTFFFQMGATHVRVPIKGILLGLLAPIGGPILGALLGWKFDARDASVRLQRVVDGASILDRAWIAWGVAWSAAILVAFTVFDPFNRYYYYRWRAQEMAWLFVLWLGPIIAGCALAHLVRWVAKGRREW